MARNNNVVKLLSNVVDADRLVEDLASMIDADRLVDDLCDQIDEDELMSLLRDQIPLDERVTEKEKETLALERVAHLRGEEQDDIVRSRLEEMTSHEVLKFIGANRGDALEVWATENFDPTFEWLAAQITKHCGLAQDFRFLLAKVGEEMGKRFELERAKYSCDLVPAELDVKTAQKECENKKEEKRE